LEKNEFYKKLDLIRDLPTLPEVVVKLNSLIDSPETTIDQVSDTIKKDQAIVGKMLRLVNSSFFGLASKVTTVPRAVVILGFDTVRNALISVSIIDSTANLHGKGVDMKAFWHHAISCAIIGRHLSVRSHIGLPEEAFTAGIVHDIGKLVLAKYFPNEFSKILEKVALGNTFYDAESGIIPIHHNEVGAYLAQRWQLPLIITEAIRFSHSMSPGNQNPIASLVLCADRIINAGCLDDAEGCSVDLPSGDILDQLRSELESSRQWIPETIPEIKTACSILINGVTGGN